MNRKELKKMYVELWKFESLKERENTAIKHKEEIGLPSISNRGENLCPKRKGEIFTEGFK